MTRLKASAIWQDAIAAILPRLGVLVAVAAPFTLLVDMVTTLFGPVQPRAMAGYTPQVVLQLMVVPALIGVIAQLAISHLIARPDEAPRTALAAALRSLPLYIGIVLLLALPLAIVLSLLRILGGPAMAQASAAIVLLMIVPAFYVVARLFPLGPIAVLERRGVVQSLQLCWTMTAGNAVPIMAFLGAAFVVLLVISLLSSGVGAAIATMFAVIGLKPVGSFAAALVVATVAMLVSIAMTAASTVVYQRLK